MKLLQVTELKKKLDVQSQLSTRRQKGDEATKHSDLEIMSLKAQKVKCYCIILFMLNVKLFSCSICLR